METARNKTKKKKVEAPKPPTAQELEVKGYLDDLESARLSDWEAGFLASVTEWWMDKGFLTEAQFDKLKGIWEKHQR